MDIAAGPPAVRMAVHVNVSLNSPPHGHGSHHHQNSTAAAASAAYMGDSDPVNSLPEHVIVIRPDIISESDDPVVVVVNLNRDKDMENSFNCSSAAAAADAGAPEAEAGKYTAAAAAMKEEREAAVFEFPKGPCCRLAAAGGYYSHKEEEGQSWIHCADMICRICHLESWDGIGDGAAVVVVPISETETETESTETGINLNLILLGCGCKGELAAAHSHCAEAWFRAKGNRVCEICGETARNVTGLGDDRFMEEWNGGSGSAATYTYGGGCWTGQPLCNLLIACLVIGFILPWFFRIRIF
ncbi:hypothetical protein Dimus_032648 [Dionaea muscipula]